MFNLENSFTTYMYGVSNSNDIAELQPPNLWLREKSWKRGQKMRKNRDPRYCLRD